MINSESRNDAKGSIRESAFMKGRLSIPEELGNLEDEYLDPLIDSFLEKHEPLKGFIFRAKDLGNTLQCVDSMLAEKVLLSFAMDNIPVLPMHDSFRIDARLYQKLEERMHRVIIENFGKPIKISNDDYVPLMDRMFGMVEDRIRSGDYGNEEELDSIIEDLESSILFSTVGKKLRKLKAGKKAN